MNVNDSCNETILPNTVLERISAQRFPRQIQAFAVIQHSDRIKMIAADNSSILFIEDKIMKSRIFVDEYVAVVKKFINLESRMYVKSHLQKS